MASTAIGKYTVVFDPVEGSKAKYECRPRVMVQGRDVTKEVLQTIDVQATWEGDEEEPVNQVATEALRELLEKWSEEAKHRR